jgi:hypothetical protein
MLIQSSFSDYYDGVARLGIDTTIRYRRDTTTIKAVSPYTIAHLPRDLHADNYFDLYLNRGASSQALVFQVIGFCGTSIVTLTAGEKTYFGAEILTLDWAKTKRYHKSSNYQIVTDCIQRFHNQTDHSLFQQFKVPIFSVPIASPLNPYELNAAALYWPTFTLNPKLSDLKFYQYKDAYSAFQDIQSYISGVLGIDPQPTIELSDKSKIIKAGFDPKTSFRKGKQPRKQP